jgi:hypothetical protein
VEVLLNVEDLDELKVINEPDPVRGNQRILLPVSN